MKNESTLITAISFVLLFWIQSIINYVQTNNELYECLTVKTIFFLKKRDKYITKTQYNLNFVMKQMSQ